ncbi:laccase-7-like [Papaver somniferum]|uniref:laccase-7-like n=1 Tax=Papaver somniferum TaxID=3469 RepID=UPI000E70089D|nr:laccase-7-like [Papaver somniferum]
MISMERLVLFLVCATAACALLSSSASAKVVEHTFDVGNFTVTRMCQQQVITAVNRSLPGPTISVNEGDTLVVHVLNKSPYNLTLHWHGIFQLFSGWADGPAYVTQCPILPGNSFTYRFNITGQEGTLWWHAHTSYLRATVYGALIIRPRPGRKYPFTKPKKEFPILLGEWWNANVYDVEEESLNFGGAPNISDAYTINGRLGDQFPCSANQTHTIQVEKGKTYLLRIINAALNNQFFFSIANHNMTVVAVDASYTNPYVTDVVVTGPGQTTDVLLKANQPVGDYYMAAHPYISAAGIQFVTNATVGIIQYKSSRSRNSSSTPIMPTLPAFNDTPTAHKFFSNLTGLKTGPFWVPVPTKIDEKMFITFGLGVSPCGANRNCSNSPFGTNLRFSASMNNHSFELPSTLSMLEAHYNNVSGIYTEDFPNNPPLVFDYTNSNLSFGLAFTEKSTKVKKLKFNSTVEMIFQNTALIGIENHPIHLHGFNFHVLAQGFGNYNSTEDEKKFNMDDPQERNTIGVPAGGWAVVRFRANNAGVWFMHCHLDVHMPWGLGTAFVVENGPTAATSLRPPPSDLPKC